MELTNSEILYSSKECEILVGSGDNGILYARKNKPLNSETAEIIKTIDSPYIARLVDYDENSVTYEYVEGTPLNGIRLSPDKVYSVFCELCDGLAALHNAGIIHRDIKPSNIILCDNGHIKIIDFDTARIKKTTADKDTTHLGTDGFAPPEQFGFSQTDERSDIYASGVTMQILLEDAYQHSRYRRVIEKCIKFNPEERYSSVKAVKQALSICRNTPILIASAITFAILCIIIAFLFFSLQSDKYIPEIPSVQSSQTSDNESNTVSSTKENDTPSESVSDVVDKPLQRTGLSYPWEIMILPADFPKLSDNVDSYYTTMGYIEIIWDDTTFEQSEEIAQKALNWTGGFLEYNSIGQVAYWEVKNSQHMLTVSCYYDSETNSYSTKLNCYYYFNEEGKIEFSHTAIKPNDFVSTKDDSRLLKWSELGVSENIPVLTDTVTTFTDQTDLPDTEDSAYYDYIFEWEKMSCVETAYIAQQLHNLADYEISVVFEHGNTYYTFHSDKYYITCTYITDELVDKNQSRVAIIML